ncbi:hypothetical protein KSD_82970 [Ktedonobacter sp. SOSP1-85]|uniref:hypothetical protein n=1 Tax=Ktedonobacter sp. SOSP1-85 TaxID=2778367 RepID=UPI001A2E9F50|nr:hypothetical protein [Ktedonobacter sp. SOSP1-85]GHO80526.1 hypothetical protein KSD_82970 [Ktedonobacter sp. SOSP1-85]
MNLDITLADFRLAQTILAPQIITTPIVEASSLLTQAGHPILLKAENLQQSGSFKNTWSLLLHRTPVARTAQARGYGVFHRQSR